MRYFRVKFGRKTVKPFKVQDLNNMIVICKKNMSKAEQDDNSKEYYMWYRNFMILHVGRNLAFRIEDLLQLKVSNLKNGTVYIREFKTKKEQSFELNSSLAKDINKYVNTFEMVDEEYLFKSRKGVNKPITRQRAWQIIKELANEVKINYIVGTHSLRKCFARTYYEKTGDLIGLQEMLNHSSPQVTLLYICWDAEDKTEKRKGFYIGS